MKKRPKVTDMTKLRLSPSSINSFYYCPRKWYKVYIEQAEQGDTIHTIRGKAVHKACEDIFDNDFMETIPYDVKDAVPILKTRIQDIFKSEWEKYTDELNALELSMHDKDDIFTQSSVALQSFIDRKIADALVHMDKGKVKRFRTAFKRVAPIFKELWVEDKVLNVGGFIDNVQNDSYSDDIALIDYKTSLRHGEMLTIDHRRQLSIYAYLYEANKGIRPRYVGIHYLLDNNTILLEVTDELIEFAKSIIGDVREKIVSWGFDESKYSDICKFKTSNGKWIEYKWNGEL